MTLLVQIPFIVKCMKSGAEKNLEKGLLRSISHRDIWEKTVANKEVMRLYKRLSIGMFCKIDKRITGTRNDIMVTQKCRYPLSEIRVSTLVIHGIDDTIVPFGEHGKILAQEISGAQLFLAERGEHVTIFTHNSEVRLEVDRFLEQML